MIRWSRHSPRTDLTQRSAKPLALGARMGVRMVAMPASASRRSKEAENLVSALLRW